MAAFLPPIRNTFVVPGLREPSDLGSGKPIIRQITTALEMDPNVEIVPLLEELYTRAFQLYQERTDKEWGMTDCGSFIVMRQQGVNEALTTDGHFQQAGFFALLREEIE